MSTPDARILRELLELIGELAEDWEYEAPITPETRFLADLGLESLDLVVLGTMVQSRFGRLPFSEYLAEIGERPVEDRDVTVADLVEFVSEQRATSMGGV